MWNTRYECDKDEAVVVIHSEAQRNQKRFVNICRDFGGGYGRATWIETENGIADIAELRLCDGFVTSFVTRDGIEIDEPCFCAMLTCMEHITGWLRLGGIQTDVASA